MKMKCIDIAVSLVFVLTLIIIYFFWGCTWDLYLTIFVVVIMVVSGIITYKQNKKIKELEEEQEYR